jgi:hypothetical protein
MDDKALAFLGNEVQRRGQQVQGGVPRSAKSTLLQLADANGADSGLLR